MVKHHPKHPERTRDIPPPPPPTPVERGGNAWGIWLVVFLIVVPLAIAMAIFTAQRHHARPQVNVIAAPAAKTPEVMLHDQIARSADRTEAVDRASR